MLLLSMIYVLKLQSLISYIAVFPEFVQITGDLISYDLSRCCQGKMGWRSNMHSLTWAKLELLKQLVTVYLNLAQGNSPAPAVKEFIHKPIKKQKKNPSETGPV